MDELPEFFLNQSDLMRIAATAAQAAGDVVKHGYAKVHHIDAKGVGDLVSQVDFDADLAATSVLKSQTSIPVLSEELAPETDDVNQEMWVVDPLDGTTAYLMAAGKEYSSVLISLCRDAVPVLGITFFPLTGEWFYAERDAGAWKNGNPLKFKHRDVQLSEAWVELNQYGNVGFETEFFETLKSALRSPNGARIVTSTFPHAGIAMRIVEQKNGLCAVVHDNNPKSLKQGPWDIAANQVIFEEAGGVFVNQRLEKTSPFVTEPIIACPSLKFAQQLVECCFAST